MTDSPMPKLNLTSKQKSDLKVILFRLDWIKILNEAIEGRRSSWGERPVLEWRNASDEVNCAVVNALEQAGLLLSFHGEVFSGNTEHKMQNPSCELCMEAKLREKK